MTLPSYLFTGNQLRSSFDDITAVVSRGLSVVEESDQKGRIYASNGGRCERAGMLLATVKSSSVKSASLMAYAKLGDAIEKVVVDALHQQNAVLFRQFHLPEVGLNLGGYVDAVILHQGKLYGLEVKSCSALPKAPKPLHYAQTAVYSAIMGLPFILFYMSRSVAKYTGELMTTQFDLPSHGLPQREALWRVAYARLAADAGLIPRVPMHLTSASDCGYCPFIPLCWEGAYPDPTWPSVVDPVQHRELSAKASDLVTHLLDPAVIADRRIGILNHIAKHGNKLAKKTLKGIAYDTLVLPPPPVRVIADPEPTEGQD